MLISRIKLKNWRNFRDAEAGDLAGITYILGPNASGKSNLLDAVRFLRDIAKPKGGGLQAAIESRDGISKLRCLHARREPEVSIEIDVSRPDGRLVWTYRLAFNSRGKELPQVVAEQVKHYDESGVPDPVLDRPDDQDRADPFRLRETHLEQISANSDFRELATFLGETAYVHLVPQLLKFGNRIGGRIIEEDPFGQEFMLRISRTQQRTRSARLKRIETALQSVVPQLSDLTFVQDPISGQPHLEIRFKHHRPNGARQREDQFSDGTLRLISLLWLIQEKRGSPLLLEEPELSLNEEVVRELARAFDKVRRGAKSQRQLIVTTHSRALLSNPGIDPAGIIRVEPSPNGSGLHKPDEGEQAAMATGLSPAEVILPRASRVSEDGQLSLNF